MPGSDRRRGVGGRARALVVVALAAAGCGGGAGGAAGAGGAGGGAGAGGAGGAGAGGAGAGGAGGAPDAGADAGAGGAGGAPDAGAPGLGGTGGGADGGAADAPPLADAGTRADGGAGGPSLCAAGAFFICEGFESTAAGAVPTGWTRTGSLGVAEGQAARGGRSLEIAAAANGPRRIALAASRLGPLAGGHWGRLFYRVRTPPPIPTSGVIHSTIVAGFGTSPLGGNVDVRLVDTVENAQGRHQYLYNVQRPDREFGRGSAYNYTYDGRWHCVEWHVDAPTQSYHFYADGAEVASIAIDNGAGDYAGSEIPAAFTSLAFGWNNYQAANVNGSPGFVAWLDEIALDANRIGCDR